MQGREGREGGRIPDSPIAHGGLDVAVQGDITRCEPAPRHAGPGWVDKLSVTERDACKWDDHSGPTDLWQGSAAFTSSVIGSGVLGQEEYFAGLSVAFEVGVGFGGLFEGVGAVDDRGDLFVCQQLKA